MRRLTSVRTDQGEQTIGLKAGVDPRDTMTEAERCALAIWLELVDQQAEAGEGTSLVNYTTSGFIVVNVDTKRILDAIEGELNQ